MATLAGFWVYRLRWSWRLLDRAARRAGIEEALGLIHRAREGGLGVRAVRRAARGEPLLAPRTVARALEEQRRLAERLTPRERQVLRLLAAGVSSRALASQLGIRYPTLRSHVRSLIGKLGVRSQLQAVARAQELGLIGEQS